MHSLSPSTHRHLVLAAVLLLFCLPLAAPAVSAQQAGDGPKINGVDIVFVIDQSGSMGGEAFGSSEHPVANDPNNLRFSGLQELVDRLGGYRLNYFQDSDVQFQIAVVYFGSTQTVVIPPTIIDPNSTDEWEPLLQKLKADLSADSFQTNLGNTDHLAALKEAKRLLDTMKGNWVEGEHHQVLFILTDGEWYMGCPQPSSPTADGQSQAQPASVPAYCVNGEFRRDIYPGLMDKWIKEEILPNDYQVFAGGINDRTKEWWSAVRSYWDAWTRNQAELLSANTMWSFFEKSLADLTVNDPALEKTTKGKVVEIPITVDRIDVNPYLKEMTLIIHKPRPDLRVKLTQDGRSLEDLPTVLVQDKDQFIERITIRNPQPGFITIERPLSEEPVRIFTMSLDADVNCEPISTAPQFIPIRLRCSIQGRSGAIPPYQDPKYQLQVEARIRSEGGEQRQVLNSSVPGEYESYFLPVQTGEYEMNLLGSTQTPNGTPFQFFGWPADGLPARFSVTPTQARLQPNSAATALLPTGISVGLVDPSGTSLAVPPDSAGFVNMQLQVNGENQNGSVVLKPGLNGYEGSTVLAEPGVYKTHLLAEVQNPTTGETFTAFNEPLGDLNVLPPKVTWQGFANPWPQYRSGAVDFVLADQNGAPISQHIDPSWQLGAEATVSGAGGSEAVALTAREAGHWQGEFTPQVAGDNVVNVTVWAQKAAGDRVVLLEKEPVFPFTVRPMSLARLSFAAPEDAEVPWKDFFWREQPLRISAGLVDAANASLVLKEVLKNPASAPFDIVVTTPTGEVIGPLPLSQGATPGRFDALFDRFPDLPWFAHRDLGVYTLSLRPLGELVETYTYETDKDVKFDVHLTRHPLWWLPPLLAGVISLGLFLYLLYQSYLNLWTAQGSIQDVNGRLIANLSGFGRHTIVLKGGLPQDVKKVKVHQPLGMKNRVVLTVWTTRGKLGPRATSPLGGVYHLPLGGASAPRISFSLRVLIYALLALGFAACFGFVVRIVLASLG